MTVADTFLFHAIQEWGQPIEARIAAVQNLLNEAGFDATATCPPVFGGIWPKPCEGDDAETASAWLKNLTETMVRGRYQDEVAHIESELAKARE